MQAIADEGYIRGHNRAITAKTATQSQKIFLGSLIVKEGKSVEEVMALYPNFSRTSLYEYAKRVRDQLPMLANGRPPAISDERMEGVVALLKERHIVDQNAVTTAEFLREVLPNAARATAGDVNRLAMHNGQLSLSTIKNIKRKINASTVTPQVKPISRVEAAKDYRNAFTMYLANLVHEAHLTPHQIGNFDSVTIAISGKKSKQKAIIIRDEETSGVPPTIPGNCDLDLCIKCMTTIVAAGYFGNMVLIVADPSMKQGESKWYKVPGLSPGTGLDDADGFLVFQRTRNVDAEYFKKYYKHVLVPFNNRMVKKFVQPVNQGDDNFLLEEEEEEEDEGEEEEDDGDDEEEEEEEEDDDEEDEEEEEDDGEDEGEEEEEEEIDDEELLLNAEEQYRVRSSYTCDGEKHQAETPIKDLLTRDMFDNNNLNLNKVPSASTDKLQESDVVYLYKLLKRILKLISAQEVLQSHRLLLEVVTKIIHKHKKGIPKKKREKYAYGIVKLVISLESILNKKMIQKAFQQTGRYPLSFDQVMSNCTTWRMMHEDQRKIVQDSIEEAAIHFRNEGTIGDKVLRKLHPGVVAQGKQKSKDAEELQLIEHRAESLTSKASRDRYQASEDLKERKIQAAEKEKEEKQKKKEEKEKDENKKKRVEKQNEKEKKKREKEEEKERKERERDLKRKKRENEEKNEEKPSKRQRLEPNQDTIDVTSETIVERTSSSGRKIIPKKK